MSGLLTALTVVAAVGCGLIGGVFFAFSSFVMPGLARLRPAESIVAMQAINVAALSFAFMLALFGTGALCAVLAVWALTDVGEPYAPLLLTGGALYVVGVIAVTIGFHVPRNDALAAVEATSRDAGRRWSRYLAQWTAGNHVRTVTALAGAAAFAAAL